MPQSVGYSNHETRGHSYDLWRDCPWDQIVGGDLNRGFAFQEDFANFPIMASATSQGGYITYQDTAATVQTETTDLFGVMGMQTAGATIQDEAELELNSGRSGLVRVSATAGQNWRLWFEARVQVNSIAAVAWFVGLAEKGSAVTNFLVDATGALVSKSAIGFLANVATVSAVHRKNGQAMITDKATALTAVASTWYRLGFTYNPLTGLFFYVNGVPIPGLAGITGITAATFPNGDFLTPMFAIKTLAAANKGIFCDWYRVAQAHDA